MKVNNNGKKFKRSNSSELVATLIQKLPLKLHEGIEFTQQYAAELIGCHRHWFRNHKKRYDIQTGSPKAMGFTPLEILKAFEDERVRERELSPIEFALLNANARVEELLKINIVLEDKVEAQRRSLHMISKNREKLDIPDWQLFIEGLD